MIVISNTSPIMNLAIVGQLDLLGRLYGKVLILLIDERRGRKVASRLGIKPIGLLGVLVEAKHKRFITAVKPVLDDMVAKAGFWVGSPSVCSYPAGGRRVKQ